MGSKYGFVKDMELGGQLPKIATEASKERWKKFQNMLVNRRTSEAMNKAMPALNKLCVFLLWSP